MKYLGKKEKKKKKREEDSGGGRWNLMKLSCESLPPEKVKERRGIKTHSKTVERDKKILGEGGIYRRRWTKSGFPPSETECWHHRSVLSICHISLVGDFYRLLWKAEIRGWNERKNFPRSFLKCGHAYQSGQDLRLENTLHCSVFVCSSLSDSFFIWIPPHFFVREPLPYCLPFRSVSLSLSFSLSSSHTPPRFKFSSWTPSRFFLYFYFYASPFFLWNIFNAFNPFSVKSK